MSAATYARIQLATLWCLLALATSASAECAWALWAQLYTPSVGAWAWQTTYPTVTEGMQAVDGTG